MYAQLIVRNSVSWHLVRIHQTWSKWH